MTVGPNWLAVKCLIEKTLLCEYHTLENHHPNGRRYNESIRTEFNFHSSRSCTKALTVSHGPILNLGHHPSLQCGFELNINFGPKEPTKLREHI
jgi:hypothetical protein